MSGAWLQAAGTSSDWKDWSWPGNSPQVKNNICYTRLQRELRSLILEQSPDLNGVYSQFVVANLLT